MKFSLIICTFKRPSSLFRLLKSVENQEIYPDRILIIDSSPDTETEEMLSEHDFKNLEYYKVGKEDSGLTRQRNYGVRRISKDCEIVCFLDDDIVLCKQYFREILKTYELYPDALGVSGHIVNETKWRKTDNKERLLKGRFYFDGWSRVEGSRFSLRRKFGLAPNCRPGVMPDFSHGYSTAFLPPSGKTYQVEMMMGGISSYKTSVFEKFSFSRYFDGYGLYEDADFSLRVSKAGKLYVNTAAQLNHLHDQLGRPDKFKYGKMVVKNGWYVWRIKYSDPSFNSRLKWHATAFLLTLIRFSNVLTTSQKKEALMESLGRVVGWWSLLVKKTT